MPLKAYVGLPRAGKSYEVVVNVILVALRQGRRVVSNIAGLNYEAMCQILYREGYPQEKIGTLIQVDHAEVEKPSFWRTDTDNETGFESFIQPGDLVALDEIWRFWKKRGDIHPRAMNFMRMHGHMSHPDSGLTCEIALITQSIRDINENIRDVIQETFQMVKNTKLGSDKSYIVHVFQRGSTNKSDFIRTLPPRFYDSAFFGLYKSHSQRKEGDAAAQEKNPDGRSNILRGVFFKVALPLALLLTVPAGIFFYRFFNPVEVEVPHAKPSAAVAASEPKSTAIEPPARPEVDERWRLVGHYNKGLTMIFVVQSHAGNIRNLVNPPKFELASFGSSVELPEGGFATSWVSFDNPKERVLP